MVEGDVKQTLIEHMAELRRMLTASTESQIELSNRKATTELHTSPSGKTARMPQMTYTAVLCRAYVVLMTSTPGLHL
jgi:hypothetical protein